MIRLFVFTTLIPFAGTAFHSTLPPTFASIAGIWKRTGMLLVEANGENTDMEAIMTKSMPCSEDSTYTFPEDGQRIIIVLDAYGAQITFVLVIQQI